MPAINSSTVSIGESTQKSHFDQLLSNDKILWSAAAAAAAVGGNFKYTVTVQQSCTVGQAIGKYLPGQDIRRTVFEQTHYTADVSNYAYNHDMAGLGTSTGAVAIIIQPVLTPNDVRIRVMSVDGSGTIAWETSLTDPGTANWVNRPSICSVPGTKEFMVAGGLSGGATVARYCDYTSPTISFLSSQTDIRTGVCVPHSGVICIDAANKRFAIMTRVSGVAQVHVFTYSGGTITVNDSLTIHNAEWRCGLTPTSTDNEFVAIGSGFVTATGRWDTLAKHFTYAPSTITDDGPSPGAAFAKGIGRFGSNSDAYGSRSTICVGQNLFVYMGEIIGRDNDADTNGTLSLIAWEPTTKNFVVLDTIDAPTSVIAAGIRNGSFLVALEDGWFAMNSAPGFYTNPQISLYSTNGGRIKQYATAVVHDFSPGAEISRYTPVAYSNNGWIIAAASNELANEIYWKSYRATLFQGFADDDATAGGQTDLRIAGKMEGLSGLVQGRHYGQSYRSGTVLPGGGHALSMGIAVESSSIVILQ